jgi:hypothetical protein
MDLLITHRITRPPGPEQLRGPDDRLLEQYEVRGLIAIYWPDDEQEHAQAICKCESGFHTGAWAILGEDSRGLFQLNVAAHTQMAAYNLFDPQINCFFAHQLWVAQGWQPWTCAKRLGIV